MTEFMPAEVVPVAAGVVVGVATARLRPRRLRLSAAIVLSAAIGSAAAYLTGELRESWAYLVFDVGQVLVAALVTSAVLELGAARRRADPEPVRRRR